MNKIGSFIYTAVCLLILLSACKEDDLALDSPNQGLNKPMNAIFELNLAFDQPAHSRAAKDSTPGNSIECRLDRLHLFAVPYDELPDGSIQEDWKRVSKAATQVPQSWSNPIRVPINLITSGKMKVYVGANLSDAQASYFIESRSYRVSKNTYYESINEFAPFKRREDGKEMHYRNPENIAMFCREAGTLDTNSKDQIVEDAENTYKVGTIYLQRMVAKVLVTCLTKENKPGQGDKVGVNYVLLKGKLAEKDDPQGWIRQENVYYFINNMPREAKFMLQYEDTDNDGIKELQAHYNLKEIFQKLIIRELPLEFYPKKLSEHFIHYELLDLYKYEKSFKPSEVWNEVNYQDLISGNPSTGNPYNKVGVGMYTLENLFQLKIAQGDANDQEFSNAEMQILWNYKALPIITQVSIAAKFVPKYIYLTKEEWETGENSIKSMQLEIDSENKTLGDWIGEDNCKPDENKGYLLVTCPNEAVAQKILTASIERKGKLRNPYDSQFPNEFPNDTFFAYTRAESLGGGTVYCSYGVAISFGKEGEVDKTMIPYTNGWGYYYTYINSKDGTPITQAEQLEDTYILRNTYYILKVTGITQLGSTITDDNYIRVHTLKAAWQEGGEGNITLN